MAKVMSKAQKENLLREYELCFQDTTSKDGLVWRTFSAIGVVSVAAVVVVVLAQGSLSWAVTALSGLVVVSLGWIWFNVANQWWQAQGTGHLRMRHIEEDLGMFMSRYTSSRTGALDLSKDPNLSLERKKDVQKDVHVRAAGVQRHLIKFFPIMAAVWCGLTVYAAVAFVFDWLVDISEIETTIQGSVALIFTIVLFVETVHIWNRTIAWVDETHKQDREAFPDGQIPRKRPFFLFF